MATDVAREARRLLGANGILAEYASEANAKSEPLILIGLESSFEKLAETAHLQPQLVQELKRNRLELDRFPREFSRLQEALELFLDRRALLI